MMTTKSAAMVALEARYPLNGLSMSNPDGLLWQNRMKTSESYFNDYSWDWEENLMLLSDVRKMEAAYGGYNSLAYSIIQNWVQETYFRNPDPLIQDKGGNRDLGKMLSDVGRAMHAKADTELKMKHGFQDQSWAGFGFQWVSFLQKAYAIPREEDPEGEPDVVATQQDVIVKRLSPYRVRFDAEGREWDMSDHTFVAVRYDPYLADLMASDKLTDDDKRRLMAWVRGGMRNPDSRAFDWSMVRHSSFSDPETDPAYIRVPCWQIWARPNHKIYSMPCGSSFTFTPLDWDEEFEEADLFPCVYMPTNREPEDKDSLRGFIGIPPLRQLRPHLYAILRLENLFLAANTNVIWKYATMKGILSDSNKALLMNDTPRAVLEIDPDALQFWPTQMRSDAGGLSLKDILFQIPQPDLKEMRHLVGIRHELDMITEILGQSSDSRGGNQDTDATATGASIRDRNNRGRSSTLKHEGGRHYKHLTKLMFLVMKSRQTLDVKYQMTTSYNEKVWMTFVADKLRDLDLHFDYAVGSGEDRTRDEEFALRERLAQVVLPVLQVSGDNRSVMKVVRDLVDVLNVHNTDEYFNDDAKELMKELMAIQFGLQKGVLDPANKEVNHRQLELISLLGSKLLNQSDLAQVVAQVSGTPEQGGGDQGAGSLPAPETPGSAAAAAGSAAAGAQGGMA